MRFVRYQNSNGGIEYGWSFNDRGSTFIGSIEGTPYSEFQRQEAKIPIEDVKLLAPVHPTKIICIGRNYSAHAKEHNNDVPDLPLIFLKPPSSIIGPEAKIYLPPQSQQVEHEAELVIVISRKGRWISTDAALEYVLGYSIGNDITARDLQRSDGQWTRAKGFDTFCPVGPWIETDFDPADALITCYVNGEMRQMATTRDMVFSIRQLIAFITSVMTLEAGDLILTGTPAGVGQLNHGDMLETRIEGIGTLRNYVVAESNT
ncbi:MAG: fumarylacetoacetate hydrolase family protein [Anaerolineales bacterium]|jgi:2-keto-4-pentenoate hydratase/2-oxohepta-3-ene-1,7-dioic acid hydratase in catechol pathway